MISFHHHTNGEILPSKEVTSEQDQPGKFAGLSGETCPVVHFAANGFFSQTIELSNTLSFDKTSNLYYSFLSEYLSKTITGISLRAPPLA